MPDKISIQPEGDTHRAPAEGFNPNLYYQTNSETNNGQQRKSGVSAASAAMVVAGTIPDLQFDSPTLSGTEAKNPGFFGSLESNASHYLSGAEQVTKDLFTGAKDEFTQHPGQLAETFAKGAAMGVVAGGALVGAALLAPEAFAVVGTAETVMAVGGALYGAYELATHAGGWIHDASVVTNPEKNTREQVAAANSDLKQVGTGATLIGAGVTGAMFGASLSGVAVAAASQRDMFAGTTSAGGGTVSDVLSNAVRNGQYQVQDVNGVSVLAPKTSVESVLNDSVSGGNYQVQNINGMSVYMPVTMIGASN